MMAERNKNSSLGRETETDGEREQRGRKKASPVREYE